MSTLKELLLCSMGIIGVINGQTNNNNAYYDGSVCIASAPTRNNKATDMDDMDDLETEYDDTTTVEPILLDVDDIDNRAGSSLFLGKSRDLDVFCGVQWDINMVTDADLCDGELCFALKNTDLGTNNIYWSNQLFLRDRITASGHELWFIEPVPNPPRKSDGISQVNIISVVPNRSNGNTLLCRRSRRNRNEIELRRDNDRNRRQRDCQWRLQKPTKRVATSTDSNMISVASNSQFKFDATLDLDPNRRGGVISLLVSKPGPIGFPDFVYFWRIDTGVDINRRVFVQGQIECHQDPYSLPPQRMNYQVNLNRNVGHISISDGSGTVCSMTGNATPDTERYVGQGSTEWTRRQPPQ